VQKFLNVLANNEITGFGLETLCSYRTF